MIEEPGRAGSSEATHDGRARRPTMGDVAAHIGVSRQLVSLVFRNAAGASQKTRDRVFEAASELGYSPDRAAQSLRRNRSNHLGVLFTMAHPFDLDLVENIYPAAEVAGYDVVLSAMTPMRQGGEAVEQLIGYRSEALILIGPELEPGHLIALAKRVPVVEVGRRMIVEGVDAVRTDDVKGLHQLVDHLVELGHEQIVHIDGGNLPGAAERRRGYRTEMRKHGLSAHIRELPGDYTEESGARAAQTLLAEARLPTAIIAGNDRCAMGAMEILIRAGVHIPKDISIAGYDDSRLSRLSYLDLTTIRQDATGMAREAVRVAVERLEQGSGQQREIVLSPQLVARGSTSIPRS